MPRFFLLLFLAAICASPTLAAQNAGDATVDVSSMSHQEVNGELYYYLFDLVYQEIDFQIVANKATLRFDAELYHLGPSKKTAGQTTVEEPTRPATSTPLLSTKIQEALLGAMGTPVEDGALLEMLLEGDVAIKGDGLDLKCSRFSHLPKDGVTILHDADLVFNDGAPNGWPMRLLAEKLTEWPDGRLEAVKGRSTTCTHSPPHYSLGMSHMTREPSTDPNKQEVWRPSGVFLMLGNIPVLPLPSHDFTEGSAFLGLERVKFLAGRAWGASLQAYFQGDAKPLGGDLNWSFAPAYSSNRGVPLFLDLSFAKEGWASEWSLFALQDQGEDLQGLASYFGRESDLRWRARLKNRFHFSGDWRLDADIALTSDPMVDLEFFLRDWMLNDDAGSAFQLRHTQKDTYFSTEFAYRFDKTGSVPLTYFGSPAGSPPASLDALPSIQFERFATPLLSIPTYFFGGDDRRTPLHFSWGASAESLQLRTPEFTPPENRPTYWPTAPNRRLQHLSAWGDWSLPLHFSGLNIRPGFRAHTSAWKESTSLVEQDSQTLREAYLDLGLTALRHYDDGWSHHLRPTVHIRDREIVTSPENILPNFSGFQNQTAGQAIEFGFRQSFYAPKQATPWFDIRLQRAWYPDPTDVFVDPMFPGPRTGVSVDGWGPTELQAFWQPRRPGEALRGMRWSGHFRWDNKNVLDETYTQLSIRPSARMFVGFAYREYLERYQQLTVSAGWRASESFSFRLSQTFNLLGDAARVNRLSAQFWGHDYVFETEFYLNEINGDEGLFFNFSPRFMAERHGSMGLPRMASARYLQDTP